MCSSQAHPPPVAAEEVSNQGQGTAGSSGQGAMGKDDDGDAAESEDDEGAGPDRLRAAREAAVKAAAYGDGILNEGKFRCVICAILFMCALVDVRAYVRAKP